MISSVLLTPAPEHREALLAGTCGSRMPAMYRQTDGLWFPWDDHADDLDAWEDCGGWAAWDAALRSLALVLAHDGKVVREGRDRAAYVLAESDERGSRDLGTIFLIADDLGLESGWVRLTGGDSNAAWRIAAPPKSIPDALHRPWSLATICAARGLGRVVLLDGDGNER
jgi:hypothetical protein